ncbi:2-dehydropantoate 2-reductase [Mycobacterium sp. NPDC006124]|uniref:ketopantoate reductase family protein n=1 Tax=Mycobacterium sp. NPDC006124 TaxID=3156729 RepID=UPI00339FCCCA
MKSPRIAFVGAGAQGSGVAADLARAGLDVTLIEQWPRHVDAIRSRGVEIHMPDRTEITRIPALHLCEVAEIREPFDIVFLVTKAYDTRWAVELIKPVLSPDGVVVGLQNGMSIDDVASIVGASRTIGAVIEMASNMFEPGVVTRQNAPEHSWFAVGALSPEHRDKAVVVQRLLAHAGTVELSDDIRSSKWMKLVANAGELVPSAILNLPLAEAASHPDVLAFMTECCREAASAALADGCQLMPIMNMTDREVASPAQYAEDLLRVVLKEYTFADTLTTVLQDWRKGRRAEIDELNGHVVETLNRHGQRAPYNEHVVRLARRIEAGQLSADPSNTALLLDVPHRQPAIT